MKSGIISTIVVNSIAVIDWTTVMSGFFASLFAMNDKFVIFVVLERVVPAALLVPVLDAVAVAGLVAMIHSTNFQNILCGRITTAQFFCLDQFGFLKKSNFQIFFGKLKNFNSHLGFYGCFTAIFGKSVVPIVHDALVIVRNSVGASVGHLPKVLFRPLKFGDIDDFVILKYQTFVTFLYVGWDQLDVVIAIRTRLLVKEPDCVDELVHYSSRSHATFRFQALGKKVDF